MIIRSFPTAIGRYEVHSLIGSGTYSEVYLAHDTKLCRNVALKIIKPEIFTLIDLEGSSMSEAKVLAKLNHPNIVTVLDIFEVDDSIAFVMEYLEGGSLKDKIERDELSFTDLISLMKQIANALEVAHDNNIVHGDVKPTNIVFDAAGVAKIIDFGLAKVVSQATYMLPMANEQDFSASMMGTLPYMAPELIRGEEASHRSDIFALGAVFYEMACGKQAFTASNEVALLNHILNDASPDVRPLNECVPNSIVVLINQMLVKNKLERSSSVRDIVWQLENLESEPKAYYKSQWLFTWAHARKLMAVLMTMSILGVLFYTTLENHNSETAISLTKQIDDGFDYLEQYAEKGRLTKAKNAFEKILLESPESAAATAGLALTLLRFHVSDNGDPEYLDRAQKTAELALQLDDKLALSHLAMGQVLEEIGSFDEAKNSYEQALNLDPLNQEANIGLANLYQRHGDISRAIGQLEKAHQQTPNTAAYIEELGRYYFRSGLYKQAENAFKRSIALKPDNPYSYSNLSATQHMLGHTPQAISTLQLGLKIRPTRRLYSNLGTYFFFQKQYPQAVEAFESALVLDGGVNDYRIWANLADSYQMIEGQTTKAKATYKRALRNLKKHHPSWRKDPFLTSQVAVYFAKSEQREEAVQALGLIDFSSSLAPDILFRGSLVKEIIGDRRYALKFLKRALMQGYPAIEVDNSPELFQLRQSPDYHYLLSTIKREP